MEMADDAIAVARREQLGSPIASVNRAYYACFYAASAVLLQEGRQFLKHSGVRGALHKYFVKTGRLSREVGKKYDELMKSRVVADYQAIIRCTIDDSAHALESAELVVAALKELCSPDTI